MKISVCSFFAAVRKKHASKGEQEIKPGKQLRMDDVRTLYKKEKTDGVGRGNGEIADGRRWDALSSFLLFFIKFFM